jgi:hypothetical protein
LSFSLFLMDDISNFAVFKKFQINIMLLVSCYLIFLLILKSSIFLLNWVHNRYFGAYVWVRMGSKQPSIEDLNRKALFHS